MCSVFQVMFDFIIKNGIVIDGSGEKSFPADLGIEKDKITKIGNLKKAAAEKIVDAEGKCVAPGFIDILDHSDNFWTIFKIPRLDSKITQGITTVIGGNCGSSLAPLIGEEAIKSIQKWVEIGSVYINWQTVGELLNKIQKNKLGLNFATLIGHETLRRGLLGDEVRKITFKEIEMMGDMLKKGLAEGAFGMSTGLVFSHAKLASFEEIKILTNILKKENALYTSHIRGEVEDLLPSVNETLQIGRETGVSMEISHLKAIGKLYWSDMKKAIEMIEVAFDEGIPIEFDIYPYTVTGSTLYILLPDWVTSGGRKKMIARLKDLDLRKRIIEEMKRMNYDYQGLVISICPYNKNVVGKKISDIAANQNISCEEAIIELLIVANGQVIVFNEVLSEENIELAMKNSLCTIASADAAYNAEYARTGEIVHPRCFGAFPKILGRYVREKKILKLEKAIHKMSGKPAQKIGLKKRGLLKNNYFADIVIFDPKNIADKANFQNPYQYSEGVDYVFVNGKMVIMEGEHTGELAGRVLKRGE